MTPFRKKQIEEQIAYSLQNPNSQQAVSVHSTKEAKTISAFINGAISSKEYEDSLGVGLPPQRIILQTDEEFRYALSFLNFSNEDFKSTIEHELSHYNNAKQCGFDVRFCITIYRSSDNKIWVVPGTQVSVSRQGECSDRRKSLGLQQTISAPQTLSEDDKLMLQMHSS